MVPPIFKRTCRGGVCYPSRTSQSATYKFVDVSVPQVLKQFVEGDMLIPHEHISQQIGKQIVIKSMTLQSQSVAVLCFCGLVRASQFRIFLSDDFPGIVRLLFFWDVCAHQTQWNRRSRSPHVLSLQLDRCAYERCVVLDKCQEFGDPFTPFSDRQWWWPWKPQPSFGRASCGNRERLRWGCDETRASLRSAAGPWVWLAPGDCALPSALTHSKEAFYSDFDTFLMSEKKECTPQLYVQIQRYLSKEVGGLHLKTWTELRQTDFLDACPTFWCEATLAWKIDTYKFYSWTLFWRYDFNDSAFDVVSEKVVIDIRMLEWIYVVTLGVTKHKFPNCISRSPMDHAIFARGDLHFFFSQAFHESGKYVSFESEYSRLPITTEESLIISNETSQRRAFAHRDDLFKDHPTLVPFGLESDLARRLLDWDNSWAIIIFVSHLVIRNYHFHVENIRNSRYWNYQICSNPEIKWTNTVKHIFQMRRFFNTFSCSRKC